MHEHEKIDYIELPAKDMAGTKVFFGEVFGWEFEDAGPDYIAFDEQGLEGGFYRSELCSLRDNGSALVVFYSNALESTQLKIVDAGGAIVIPITPFPGGRRFHFSDPNGNEFAVWSDLDSKGNVCP